MEILTEISELVGKTIVSAKWVDVGDVIALIFSDDSCVLIGADCNYELSEPVFLKSVDDDVKHEAGILSDREFQAIKREKNERIKKNIEKQEREMLERLKAKYES